MASAREKKANTAKISSNFEKKIRILIPDKLQEKSLDFMKLAKFNKNL